MAWASAAVSDRGYSRSAGNRGLISGGRSSRRRGDGEAELALRRETTSADSGGPFQRWEVRFEARAKALARSVIFRNRPESTGVDRTLVRLFHTCVRETARWMAWASAAVNDRGYRRSGDNARSYFGRPRSATAATVDPRTRRGLTPRARFSRRRPPRCGGRRGGVGALWGDRCRGRRVRRRVCRRRRRRVCRR